MKLRSAALAFALALLAAGVGAAFAAGVGPAPGGPAAGTGEDVERFPTETTAADAANGSADGGPAFGSTVDRIEPCGTTCRDVTGTVRNRGNATATDVVVYTRVYAGEDADGEGLWTGRREVGRLALGESYTSTERVELSYADAYAIREAGGRVTVVTTVESATATETFVERRTVA